jgi:hypothetical protein
MVGALHIFAVANHLIFAESMIDNILHPELRDRMILLRGKY